MYQTFSFTKVSGSQGSELWAPGSMDLGTMGPRTMVIGSRRRWVAIHPAEERRKKDLILTGLYSEFSLPPSITRESRHRQRFRKQFAEVTGHTGPGVPRSGGGGQVFSQELREEFGHYVRLHGVEATVQVYSVGGRWCVHSVHTIS